MIVYVFQKYPENFAFQIFINLQQFTREICYFLKKQPTFQQFLLSFLLINKTLQFDNLNTRIAMNAKISVSIICIEAIIYLLLFNLHDCTFKGIEVQENKNEGWGLLIERAVELFLGDWHNAMKQSFHYNPF